MRSTPKKSLKHFLRLAEADEDPKHKLKDKVHTDFEFADPTSKGELTAPKPKTDGALAKPKVASRRATQTTRLADNLPDTSDAVRSFIDAARDLADPEEADVVDGVPEPVPPNNLPAVIVPPEELPAKIESETGEEVNIVWHKVSNLPHFNMPQIRRAFTPLFRDLLDIELGKVLVATDLAGTSHIAMRALIGYLGRNGQRDDDFNLNAFGIDPRIYNVDQAYVISCDGHRFLVMRERHSGAQDFFYVYMAEGKGRGTDLEGPSAETKRIGR